MSLAEPATRAASLAREAEYVRILAAPTGDAVAASALLLHAFRRDGIDAHVTFRDDLGALPSGVADESCVFLVDGWARPLSELGDRAVLLAHDGGAIHGDAVSLGPEKGGFDGATEASAAALAYLVADALDRKNRDLVTLALAGAYADRQDAGGLAGLNGSLLAEAEEAGVVERRKGPGFSGTVVEALAGAEPYLKGVGGRARAAAKLARELKLDPELAVGALEDAEQARLVSSVALHLLEQGAVPSAVDALVPTDVVAKSAGPVPAGTSARRLGHALAAAAPGHAGGALAELLQGRIPAGASETLPLLIRAERAPEAAIEAPAGHAMAAAALTSLYLTRGRPAVAWEPRDGRVLVAARAPRESSVHVAAALRRAVKDRGLVAGHRLAARALVPAEEKDAVLADLAAAWEG